MRISDWSSDVCSSDLRAADRCRRRGGGARNGDVHALAYLPHQPGWLSRVVEPRLSSSVFVTALMRRAESEGGYAAVLSKGEIGRASRWEWVWQYASLSGVAATFKKKIYNQITH